MEKRYFLAFFLSFLVILLWSMPSSKKHANRIETTSINQQESKPVFIMEKDSNKEVDVKTSDINKADVTDFKDELTTIETNKLKLVFSNKGGNLNSIFLTEFNERFPLNGLTEMKRFSKERFNLITKRTNSLEYVFENNDYLVRKIFNFDNDSYLVTLDFIVKSKNQLSNLQVIDFKAFTIDSSNLEKSKTEEYTRDRNLFEYAISSKKDILRKNNAYHFNAKNTKEETAAVNWLAFRNRFYSVITKPLFEVSSFSITPVDQTHLDVSFSANLMSDQKYSTVIFVGPEKTSLLKSYNYGFENVKRYYRWGLFDGIAKLIEDLMNFTNKLIPNWGLTIIVLSTLIYLITYPMTVRSFSSMKKMQSLQPQITKLKEKYSNNPQKMNVEVMELYKRNKVNPFGGCLPMLLQMPVFIGLYQVLWRSVSFKGADFLWIKDLSLPDKLFEIPFKLPILNTNDFNLLPILMMIVMYFQQKISSKNMVGMGEDQAKQQKFMGIFFVFFIGFIFYNFSSGLTLYFFLFYLFSFFTQWKLSKNTVAVS